MDPTTHDLPFRSAGRRPGFSFIEVLFAVMILGIGFILIAGVFPVAISQTASSQEETAGATMANSVVSAITSIPNLQSTAILPNDGAVTRLVDQSPTLPLYGYYKGNQINPDDPRFAWIPLLKRDTADFRGQPPAVAELIIVAVQVRGRSSFGPADLVQTGTGGTATGNLLAHPVTISLTEGQSNAAEPRDKALLSGTDVAAAAPGAAIILGQGGSTDASGRPVAGRIYRLAEPTGTANEWYLLPGNDMSVIGGANENVSSVTGWLVGQGYVDPANPAGGFGGGSMVVGTYVSYITVK